MVQILGSTSSPLSLTDSYTYDPHGSMLTMPHLTAMEWDYADRLKHTQRANGTGAQHTYFTYDATGQRVRKVALAGATLKERIYLGGYEVYRERVAAPAAPIDFERQTLHVTDDQRRVAMAETKTIDGGAVVPTLTTRWRFQLDNHLGSATMELDDTGSVISYEEFHPYGSTAFHTANGAAQVSAKRYRYTGKEKDEETGLYYHGARYYAPWLGRWTAADPIGVSGGLNVYRYSRDNPIMFSDPGGTEPFAKPGSNDYKVGTSTDPELIGYLKSLSPAQRGEFVGGATGKFQERAQAALHAGRLSSQVSVGEVLVEGSRPAGSAQSTGGPEAREEPEQERNERRLNAFLTLDAPPSEIADARAPTVTLFYAIAYDTKQKIKAALAQPEEREFLGRDNQVVKFTVRPDPAKKAAAFGELALMVAPHLVAEKALVEGAVGTEAAASAAEGAAALEASSATNAALLRNQLISEELAGGHAFEKHVLQQAEFPGIATRGEFASKIESFLNSPETIMRNLSNGRTAYWNEGMGNVLIRNPAAADGGTFFAPTAGSSYFWGLQ